MFAWSCVCGEGGAAWSASYHEARAAGELHLSRVGRARTRHAVIVHAAAPVPPELLTD